MNNVLRQKVSAVDEILYNSAPFKSAMEKYPMESALQNALTSKVRLLDSVLHPAPSASRVGPANPPQVMVRPKSPPSIWVAEKVSPPSGVIVGDDAAQLHKDQIARSYLNYLGSSVIPSSSDPDTRKLQAPVISKIASEAKRLHVFLPPLPTNGYYGNDLLVADVAGTVHSATTGQPLQGAVLILVSAPRDDVRMRIAIPGGKRQRNVAAVLSEVADGLAAVGGPREDGRRRRVALFSATSGVRGQFVLRAAPGVYQVVADLAGYAQSTTAPIMTRAEAAAHRAERRPSKAAIAVEQDGETGRPRRSKTRSGWQPIG